MESIDEVDTVTDASFNSHDQTVLPTEVTIYT